MLDEIIYKDEKEEIDKDSSMKLRMVHNIKEEFYAEITIEYIVSITGTIALKRNDTGDIIALRDCFGLPVKAFKKYDIIMMTIEEAAQLKDAGYYDYIK